MQDRLNTEKRTQMHQANTTSAQTLTKEIPKKTRARPRTWGKGTRERANQRQQATRSTPEGSLIHNLRNRVNQIMKTINATKYETTLELLGCDAITVKEYIENQFTQGISWENH